MELHVVDVTMTDPITKGALRAAHVTSKVEFASLVGRLVARDTRRPVTGVLIDGYVHLLIEEQHLRHVSDYLKACTLPHCWESEE